MKIKALLHCKKAKNKDERLMISCKGEFKLAKDFLYITDYPKIFNSKIVAECDFKVETIALGQGYFSENGVGYFRRNHGFPDKELEEYSCMSFKELDESLLGLLHKNCGYAINFSNLHIFDTPKELYDCFTKTTLPRGSTVYKSLKAGPSNMKRIWMKENGDWVMYILISFDPESLCMILNGKKTIEPRATILKEMIPECI